MKIYAFIFARGGSKGIKKKNIVKLNKKPLILHTIHLAKKLKYIEKIFVSTDDKEIRKIAISSGVNVISRPSYLATDKSGEWKSWQHAVKYIKKNEEKFDIFLSLPSTSPLRSLDDINKSIKLLTKNVDIVVTIAKANRNPWFNMVKKDKNGYLKIVNKIKKTIIRRQDAPEVYDLTTIAYVTRPKFIMNNQGIFNGRVKGLEIEKKRALDIDDNYDLEIAEFLLSKKMKKKKKNEKKEKKFKQ